MKTRKLHIFTHGLKFCVCVWTENGWDINFTSLCALKDDLVSVKVLLVVIKPGIFYPNRTCMTFDKQRVDTAVKAYAKKCENDGLRVLKNDMEMLFWFEKKVLNKRWDTYACYCSFPSWVGSMLTIHRSLYKE